jgi:hypothetical protein
MTVQRYEDRATQPQSRFKSFEEATRVFATERVLPIVLDLPGLAGAEWKDADLLKYVCEVIDDSEQLLPRITADLKSEYRLVRFHELRWIVIALRAQQTAEEVEFPCAGIASLRRLGMADVLYHICDALHEARASIQKHTRRLDRPARLKWAEALMIAEAVVAREGVATELDNLKHGERSRLHQRAWDCRVELARSELCVALKHN